MANGYATKLWMILIITLALGLAACLPVQPESAATPAATEEAAGDATVEATEEPAEEATAEPTEEPTEEATAEPTEEATAEAAGEDAEMGGLVRQILAQQLQVDLDQIEIVSVEAVEWPDACLGVYSADIMCAQVITPGYRVVLAVNGEQYEYHTNADGSFVQLFSAPEANVGDVVINWQQTLDICQSAQIGREGIIFGPCMGVQMGGKLVSPEREEQLIELIASYAPFEAETAAGIVNFVGAGSVIATPAEQRMVAEWARLVAQEAAAGRSGASWGLAFAWHRQGGFAGFCDDLTTYVSGQVYAATCKGESPENVGQRRMTADELQQLYAWIDEFAPFEYSQDDGAVADSMQVTLIFSGAGNTQADDAIQQDIMAFAQDLYAGLS